MISCFETYGKNIDESNNLLVWLHIVVCKFGTCKLICVLFVQLDIRITNDKHNALGSFLLKKTEKNSLSIFEKHICRRSFIRVNPKPINHSFYQSSPSKLHQVSVLPSKTHLLFWILVKNNSIMNNTNKKNIENYSFSEK